MVCSWQQTRLARKGGACCVRNVRGDLLRSVEEMAFDGFATPLSEMDAAEKVSDVQSFPLIIMNSAHDTGAHHILPLPTAGRNGIEKEARALWRRRTYIGEGV